MPRHKYNVQAQACAICQPLPLLAAFLIAATMITLHMDAHQAFACRIPSLCAFSATFIMRALGKLHNTRAFAILLGITLGLVSASWRTPHPSKATLQPCMDHKPCTITGVIKDPPATKKLGISFMLHLPNKHNLRIFVPTQHIPKDRFMLPGTRWSVLGVFGRNPRARLPFERSRTQHARLHKTLGRLRVTHVPRYIDIDIDTPTRSKDVAQIVQRRLVAHRFRLEQQIRHAMGDDASAWALAMTLGSKGLLSDAQKRPFAITGTSHLLAISGLHLGALAAALWWFTRGLWMLIARKNRKAALIGQRRLSAPVVLTLLALYVLTIGAPISALRALGMVASILFALLTSKRMSSIHALAMATIVMCLWSPHTVWSPGFQLSVLATLGILMYIKKRRAPDTRTRWDTIKSSIGVSIGVSLSASIATTPIVLGLSAEIPVAGFWLNTIVTPLVGVCIFPMLAIGVAIFPWIPTASKMLLHLGASAMEHIALILFEVSIWPGSVCRPGPLPDLAIFILIGATLMFFLSERKRHMWLAILLACCTLIYPQLEHAMRKPSCAIHAVDVGQGDATLVEFPHGETLLIDAGGARMGRDPGYHLTLPYLRHRGIHKLDAIVLTHPDLDHMEGLHAILDHATPTRMFVGSYVHKEPGLVRLLEHAQERGVEIHEVKHTQHVSLATDVHTKFFWPQLDEEDVGKNDRGIVISLRYAKTHTLILGDLEHTGEEWLITQKDVGATTILKVGHHGSKTSSTHALLEHTQPQFAIISCGWRNRYGHPHPRVIQRLVAYGATLLRTDHQGSLITRIQKDGLIKVHTMHASERIE